MENVWFLASLWVGLALIATLVAIWLKISTALSEIVVGTVAQLTVGVVIGRGSLGGSSEWVGFLAGTGAILLTFLAGAELDPVVFRRKWREATVIGLVGFFAPFMGATAVARLLLGWDLRASWLAGVALSTTSVAVVYAVMLELGFNRTEFGKAILAACFINDLGTVIALGLIFSPFTMRTLVFVVVSVIVFALLPYLTPRFFVKYGGRVSELEAKYLLFALFLMGGFAVWAGSEAVLPAYIIGMVLAGTPSHGHVRSAHTVLFHSRRHLIGGVEIDHLAGRVRADHGPSACAGGPLSRGRIVCLRPRSSMGRSSTQWLRLRPPSYFGAGGKLRTTNALV